MNEVCVDCTNTNEYFTYFQENLDLINVINHDKWNFILTQYKKINLKTTRKIFKKLREYIRSTPDLELVADYFLPDIEMTVGEFCICHILKK